VLSTGGRKCVAVFAAVVSALGAGLPANAGQDSTLVVPAQYPTVQAAVDAASPGDTIRVRRGTYTEQVSIGKDLRIVGAGRGSTKLRAPAVLNPGALGKKPSIVEIHSGATVRMSNLTVAGPGSSECGPGSLAAGIRVVQNATLHLRRARVANIHDTPFASCEHNGIGILIGDFIDGESGNATIRDVEVANYQEGGLIAFGDETHVLVTDSVLVGNRGGKGWTYGLEWGAGAVLVATHNLLMGNFCDNPNPALACGRDPTKQAQSAGIGSGPGDVSPGSVIAHNTIIGNDVGIYLFAANGCCEIHDNYLIDNRYFGVLVQEGHNKIFHTAIVGGEVGVAAYATFFSDARARLDHVTIRRTTVAKTREVDCCGFDAKVVVVH
jgi:nitrous oxidase accessory protein NosD